MLLPRSEVSFEEEGRWMVSFLQFDEHDLGRYVNLYEPQFKKEMGEVWQQREVHQTGRAIKPEKICPFQVTPASVI
nr:unnamed protein product [Callosobruchus analis]